MQASYPILSFVMLLPIVGIVALLLCRQDRHIKALAMSTAILTFLLSLLVLKHFDNAKASVQLIERYVWLSKLNLEYFIGVDGFSVLMLPLSAMITVIAIALSWQRITTHIKLYYSLILTLQSIVVGVFISLNLIMFFIIWEAMLIPTFLLIGMWGGQGRRQAAIKYLIYAFAGSIFMFVAMMVLYFKTGKGFDMVALANCKLPFELQIWLFAGFALAFAVKVPLVPLHSWQPDAYYESPLPVTLILSAVLAKMGVYGFVRMPFSFFPEASVAFSTALIVLSLVSILYGTYLALAQDDLKRLITYASLSHMGFMTLAIATFNQTALQGALLQMINHAVITGALFICAGILYEMTGTYKLSEYGGVFKSAPLFAVIFTFFSLATTGFPGLSYFFGEFLILSGVFKSSFTYGFIAIIGVVLGLCYTSWAYYRLILFDQGRLVRERLTDISGKYCVILLPFMILTLWLGVQPFMALQFISATVKAFVSQ